MKREFVEFCGFIMGEGCLRLIKKTQMAKRKGWKTHVLYVPSIQIALRDDDSEILEWAKSIYGGTLLHRNGRPQIPNQNPYCVWIITGSTKCKLILDQLMKCKLPSKKIREAKILLEICNLKLKIRSKGHKGLRYKWFTEEEMLRHEEIYNELKRLKKYNEQ